MRICLCRAYYVTQKSARKNASMRQNAEVKQGLKNSFPLPAIRHRRLSRKCRAHFSVHKTAHVYRVAAVRIFTLIYKVATLNRRRAGGSGAHRYFVENCIFACGARPFFSKKKRAFFQSAKQSKMKKYFCIYFLKIPPQYSLTIDGGSGSIYLYDFTP